MRCGRSIWYPWCSTLWSAPDLLHKRRRVVPAAEFDEFISPPRCGAEMVVTLIHLFSLCLRLWGWAIMSVLPTHLLPRLCHVIQTRRESFLRYFRYTAFVQKWATTWVRGTSLQTSLVVQVKTTLKSIWDVYEMLRRGWKLDARVEGESMQKKKDAPAGSRTRDVTATTWSTDHYTTDAWRSTNYNPKNTRFRVSIPVTSRMLSGRSNCHGRWCRSLWRGFELHPHP